jgi:hypothetical protein
MRRAILALWLLAGCGGERDAGRGVGSGSAAPVKLRARPAAVVEITLKALGVT